MGFRQGAYARVWEVKNEGKYSTARVTVSRKNKNTDAYETEFSDGFVRLVGQAHNDFQGLSVPVDSTGKSKGVSVKITSCDVTNFFRKGDKVSYTPQYVIFGCEFPNGEVASGTTSESNSEKLDKWINVADEAEEELPFK